MITGYRYDDDLHRLRDHSHSSILPIYTIQVCKTECLNRYTSTELLTLWTNLQVQVVLVEGPCGSARVRAWRNAGRTPHHRNVQFQSLHLYLARRQRRPNAIHINTQDLLIGHDSRKRPNTAVHIGTMVTSNGKLEIGKLC